jgi:hypothetical protein
VLLWTWPWECMAAFCSTPYWWDLTFETLFQMVQGVRGGGVPWWSPGLPGRSRRRLTRMYTREY